MRYADMPKTCPYKSCVKYLYLNDVSCRACVDLAGARRGHHGVGECDVRYCFYAVLGVGVAEEVGTGADGVDAAQQLWVADVVAVGRVENGVWRLVAYDYVGVGGYLVYADIVEAVRDVGRDERKTPKLYSVYCYTRVAEIVYAGRQVAHGGLVQAVVVVAGDEYLVTVG